MGPCGASKSGNENCCHGCTELRLAFETVMATPGKMKLFVRMEHSIVRFLLKLYECSSRPLKKSHT